MINFGTHSDWLSIEVCPPSHRRCVLTNITAASAQIAGVDAVLGLAKALAKAQDVERYTAMLRAQKEAFHEAFFNSSSGSYVGDFQTAQIMALYFDITPVEHQRSVASALVRSITDPAGPVHDVNHHCNGTTPCLASGFWGTRYALQVLSRFGHADLALAVATKTSAPSWGAMALSKPGTLWESWVGASRDHPAFGGGIATWLYSLAGVDTDKGSASGDLVIALPGSKIAAEIGSAQVSVAVSPSSSVVASVDWRMGDYALELAVYIPVAFTGKATASFSPPLACSSTTTNGSIVHLARLSRGELLIGEPKFEVHQLTGRVSGVHLTTGRSIFRFACDAN